MYINQSITRPPGVDAFGSAHDDDAGPPSAHDPGAITIAATVMACVAISPA